MILLTQEVHGGRCQWGTQNVSSVLLHFCSKIWGLSCYSPLPTFQGAKALLLLPHEEGIPEIPDSVILGASSIPDEALSYSISLMSLPDTAPRDQSRGLSPNASGGLTPLIGQTYKAQTKVNTQTSTSMEDVQTDTETQYDMICIWRGPKQNG